MKQDNDDNYTILENLSQIVTLSGAHKKDGRNLKVEDLSIIDDASLVFNDQEILWLGKSYKLPKKYLPIKRKYNLRGKILLPEIVDSHTHLVFSGDRSTEYVARLNGSTYQDIAARGGGISYTCEETRSSSTEELFQLGCERIERMHSYGVGTIEIKSGYALDYEKEYELSFVIDKLKKHFSPQVQIINTFMAAHAVPRGLTSKQYLEETVKPLMIKLSSKGIIDFVDIFFEENYFSKQDVLDLSTLVTELGLKLKVHVDEFNDNKGAVLATQLNAHSADHLLMTSDDGIEALSNSETVATFLPGTCMFLGKPLFSIKNWFDKGVKIALASDFNPGSCHFDNLFQLANFAAPTYKMNQAQLWSSITLNAAHSVGLKDQGAIVKGLRPRFSIFNVRSIDELSYNWGKNYFEKLNFFNVYYSGKN